MSDSSPMQDVMSGPMMDSSPGGMPVYSRAGGGPLDPPSPPLQQQALAQPPLQPSQQQQQEQSFVPQQQQLFQQQLPIKDSMMYPQGLQAEQQLYMPPLEHLLSNQSVQSNTSFQSNQSFGSSQQNSPFPEASSSSRFGSGGGQQQQQLPMQSPAVAALTAAGGQQQQHHKSRRWSLTGRFFEKRKSVTEPFHIPNSQPQNFSASYNSTNNGHIVYGNPAAATAAGTLPSAAAYQMPPPPSPRQQQQQQGSSLSSGQPVFDNNGKQISPPGSNGGSRRSSLADIPKAFLSSLRRGSLSGSSESSGSSGSMAVGMNGGSGGNGAIAEEAENGESAGVSREEAMILTGGQANVKMATLKPPPKDPWALAQAPPLKSILKKRLPDPAMDTTAAAAGGDGFSNGPSGGGGPGDVPGATASSLDSNHSSRTTTSSLDGPDVHPMASNAEGVDINLLAPTDHRARLLTHSPTPNHPQQHLLSPNWSAGGPGSPLPNGTGYQQVPIATLNELSWPPVSTEELIKMQEQDDGARGGSGGGAAMPADFTQGVQTNSFMGNRGGERSQGQISSSSMGFPQQQPAFAMSSRAQDLAAQYYSGSNGGGNTSPAGLSPSAMSNASSNQGVGGFGGGGGGKRRSINFLETIEVIPAHRKAEYNRQSDKHATFKILTPDLKSEIRDELNTYKMREMAVHVESMGNTAFH